jgi:hypothetical protein
MKDLKNNNGQKNFIEAVEKRIQEVITKGKDQKVIFKSKPKSGKGL